VKVWMLFDKRQVTASGQSMKIHEEFNCTEEKSRVTAAIAYLGLSGSGKADVLNTQNEPWNPIPPGSVHRIMFDYACK